MIGIKILQCNGCCRLVILIILWVKRLHHYHLYLHSSIKGRNNLTSINLLLTLQQFLHPTHHILLTHHRSPLYPPLCLLCLQSQSFPPFPWSPLFPLPHPSLPFPNFLPHLFPQTRPIPPFPLNLNPNLSPPTTSTNHSSNYVPRNKRTSVHYTQWHH